MQFKTPNFQIDKLVYNAEIRPLVVAAVATAQPRFKAPYGAYPHPPPS
jgi:hypothetical protein